MALSRYPVNPDYGTGVYRRRVRVLVRDHDVVGVLNDDYHAMWCRIGHRDGAVVEVEGGLVRAPKSTCGGAVTPLNELVGMAVSTARWDLYGDGRAGRNCTHLLDLAVLAMGRISHGAGEIVYDVALDDAVDGVSEVRAHVDGTMVHRWTVDDGTVVSPVAFTGRRLFSGFSPWAQATFDGPALDAALLIQKAAFVSRGRRHIVGGAETFYNRDEVDRVGDCFSFRDDQLAVGFDVRGYFRDFSTGIVEFLPDLSGPERFKPCDWIAQ